MSLDSSPSLKWTAIVVRLLLALFAATLVYEIGRAALTGGENATGSLGDRSSVCVASPSILDVEGNVTEDPRRARAVAQSSGVDDTPYLVEKGVDFAHGLPQLCKDDSSLGTQSLYQTSRFATPLVVLVALFLLDRLIRDARRDSGFDETIVRKLRFLGVFLIAGTLAASLYTTIVETGLAVSMVAGTVREVGSMALRGWSFPWAYLIAGLGLVVMSKVVRVGAHMREELEGTV
ncbi:DUF2975 domain-containing protein [Nonomuraea bangladeshensis]